VGCLANLPAGKSFANYCSKDGREIVYRFNKAEMLLFSTGAFEKNQDSVQNFI
jgi:hypothetical protein